MVDVAPGELGDVDEAVHPVEVDEGAEVDDVGDLALDDVAGAETVEDRLAHLLALVLEDGRRRESTPSLRERLSSTDLAAQLAGRGTRRGPGRGGCRRATRAGSRARRGRG